MISLIARRLYVKMRGQLSLRWSFHNAKVSRMDYAVSFGLPCFRGKDGFRVCPGAGRCRAICYARQGRYRLSPIGRRLEENLVAARSDGFNRRLGRDLVILYRHGVRTVRMHDSGDFFGKKYLYRWIRQARRFPDIRFYGYTKSIPLLAVVSDRPANFVLVQSYGGRYDSGIDRSQPWSRVYRTAGDLNAAVVRGEVAVDGSQSDEFARDGVGGGIGLVYHGNRRRGVDWFFAGEG